VLGKKAVDVVSFQFLSFGSAVLSLMFMEELLWFQRFCGRQVGKWQLALCFLKGFRSITPDLISYNATMSSCEKGGKWQMALHVFLDMYKMHGSNSRAMV